MHEREVGDEKDRRIREMEKESAELARANEIFQEMLGFSQRTERSKSPSSIRFRRRKQRAMIGNGYLPGVVGQRGITVTGRTKESWIGMRFFRRK